VQTVYDEYEEWHGDTLYYDNFFAMTPTVTSSRGASGSEVELVTLAFKA